MLLQSIWPALQNIPTGLIVMLALGIPLGVVMTILVVKTVQLEKEIIRDGILTGAVVVRCESRREDGKTRYYPYVRYKAYDGREYEARINVRTNFPIGRKIKIKYIPQKYDYVAFVSQEIGSECQ